MNGALLRRAEAADLESVAAVERECFPQDAWPSAYLLAAIDGEMVSIRVLVVEVAGEVVAHAIVSVVFEIAELQRIGVTAAHRRRGFADLLLHAGLDLARTEGAERLLLEVRADNGPALALYRGTGFAEIGRREHYYRDGTDAIILRHDLT